MKEWFRSITKSEIRNVLAVTTVIGAFGVLILLIMKPIPGENKDTINLAVGFVLGGLVAGVNGYYFGASKGVSDKKEEKEQS